MVKDALAGWGAVALGMLVIIRVLDRSVSALVQSWYIPILEVSAVGLVVLGITVIVRAIDAEERRPLKLSIRGVFAVAIVAGPLIVGFVMKPEPLSGRSLDSSDVSAQRQFLQTVGAAEPLQRNVYQWASAFSTDAPNSLTGQPVDLIGFVHHGRDDGGDRFTVARFVVACCVADAYGFSLPVQWKGADGLKDDGWIHLKGKVGLGPSGQPIVLADSIESVKAPDNPYIYP